jgi:hypothetical protein
LLNKIDPETSSNVRWADQTACSSSTRQNKSLRPARFILCATPSRRSIFLDINSGRASIFSCL